MRLVDFISLFLAVTLLSAAAASAGEVDFSGDARARYVIRDNRLFGNLLNNNNDFWDSRVRINMQAKTVSGAYAKARIRFESDWNKPREGKQTITPWVDIAYLGIPLGRATIEAGLMKSNIDRFFEWDQSVDRAALQWDMYGAEWLAVFDMLAEAQFSPFEINRLEDNDFVAYGLVVKRKFLQNLTGQASFFYKDDKRNEYVLDEFIPSASGPYWSIYVEGEYENLAFETDLAFKAADTRQSRDEDGYIINPLNVGRGNGWGWYAEGRYSASTLIPILNVGAVVQGYKADNDFGWIMIGNSNNEPTAVISQVGKDGDWFWIAPSILYKPTERLDIRGNLVWMYIDSRVAESEDDLTIEHLYELSGELTYEISPLATFTWKAGVLKPKISGLFKGKEAQDDAAFATYARFQIHF